MSESDFPQEMLDLRDRVDAENGILTLPMHEVRDAYGSERLGVNVRANITAMLQQLGIQHTPRNLPGSQHELVRLYKRGSAVGKLIQAALRPGTEADETLRTAASSGATRILEKVKELVCS
jgi:hypothetical protein